MAEGSWPGLFRPAKRLVVEAKIQWILYNFDLGTDSSFWTSPHQLLIHVDLVLIIMPLQRHRLDTRSLAIARRMGEVVRARDTKPKGSRVKCAPAFGADPERLPVLSSKRSSGFANHPKIAQIYESGSAASSAVMECPGRPQNPALDEALRLAGRDPDAWAFTKKDSASD